MATATSAKPADKRNEKGQFGAGNNANPGGRPKGLMQYAREKTQDGRLLVDFAMDVFEGKPQPMVIRKALPDGTTVEQTFEATPNLEQRFEALTWLADRGFGKPTQKLEGEVRVPIGIVHRLPAHDPLAKGGERVLDVTPERVPGVPRRQLRP